MGVVWELCWRGDISGEKIIAKHHGNILWSARNYLAGARDYGWSLDKIFSPVTVRNFMSVCVCNSHYKERYLTARDVTDTCANVDVSRVVVITQSQHGLGVENPRSPDSSMNNTLSRVQDSVVYILNSNCTYFKPGAAPGGVDFQILSVR